MSARMSFSVVNEASTFISPLPIAQNDASSEMDDAAIQIPDDCWEPVDFLDGDETGIPSQLLATLHVNTCPMHFEAYLVDEQGEICDPRHQQAITLVKAALRDDEPWKSFNYGGHEYVMIAIPFGMGR
ncbi:hypothetical protein [Sedimenticola hydrogenitrophicus]|uniref:hypothetical protein n=1 Tax=Sedimenticola hydrogenitrophicus TaxID=2967975 RepID=UPI0021A87F86|nr:hypothetical protein [Sedimenticola hydrogenitrophicus]